MSNMPTDEQLDEAYRSLHNLAAAYEGLGVLKSAMEVYSSASSQYTALLQSIKDAISDRDSLRESLATLNTEWADRTAAHQLEYSEKEYTLCVELSQLETRVSHEQAILESILSDIAEKQNTAIQIVEDATEVRKRELRGEIDELIAERLQLSDAVYDAQAELVGLQNKLIDTITQVRGLTNG